MRLRCRAAAVAFSAATILAALPAWAQTREENVDLCTSDNPDVKIAACTAMIQSGRESIVGLYVAYNQRGLAYDAKGLYGQAIADYTELIALLPTDRGGYVLRGGSYEKNGQRDQAIADYRAALKFDPENKKSLDGLKRLGAAP